jgi:uncharacterized membrane protein
MMWNYGWGWLAVLGMLLCVGMMVMMMTRHSASGHTRQPSHHDEDAPERVLDMRLARGEIDTAEYERLRSALQRKSPSLPDAPRPGDIGRQ